MSEVNAMVPAGDGDGEMARWDPRRAERNLSTSLDLATEAGRVLLVRALGGKDRSTDDVLNEVIEVVDYVVHPVSLTSPEGEVKAIPRTVLILADGSTVGACSQGVFSSLAMICQLISTPPWKPAIRLKVVSRPTRTLGRRIVLLELAEPLKPEVLAAKPQPNADRPVTMAGKDRARP